MTNRETFSKLLQMEQTPEVQKMIRDQAYKWAHKHKARLETEYSCYGPRKPIISNYKKKMIKNFFSGWRYTIKAKLPKWLKPRHCGWVLFGILENDKKVRLGHYHNLDKMRRDIATYRLTEKYVNYTGIIANSL